MGSLLRMDIKGNIYGRQTRKTPRQMMLVWMMTDAYR